MLWSLYSTWVNWYYLHDKKMNWIYAHNGSKTDGWLNYLWTWFEAGRCLWVWNLQIKTNNKATFTFQHPWELLNHINVGLNKTFFEWTQFSFFIFWIVWILYFHFSNKINFFLFQMIPSYNWWVKGPGHIGDFSCFFTSKACFPLYSLYASQKWTSKIVERGKRLERLPMSVGPRVAVTLKIKRQLLFTRPSFGLMFYSKIDVNTYSVTTTFHKGCFFYFSVTAAYDWFWLRQEKSISTLFFY